MFLAGSFYGKFFARNLHLMLLKRRPDEWKQNQVRLKSAKVGTAPTPSTPAPVASAHITASQDSSNKPVDEEGEKSSKRKRTDKPRDEIEELFATASKTKKSRKGESRPPPPPAKPTDSEPVAVEVNTAKDEDMTKILGAIKAVPKGQALAGKSKKKRH